MDGYWEEYGGGEYITERGRYIYIYMGERRGDRGNEIVRKWIVRGYIYGREGK